MWSFSFYWRVMARLHRPPVGVRCEHLPWRSGRTSPAGSLAGRRFVKGSYGVPAEEGRPVQLQSIGSGRIALRLNQRPLKTLDFETPESRRLGFSMRSADAHDAKRLA